MPEEKRLPDSGYESSSLEAPVEDINIILKENLSSSEMKVFFNLTEYCINEGDVSILDRKSFPEDENFEDFLEVLANVGVVTKAGKSDHGIKGWIWRLNRPQYDMIKSKMFPPISETVSLQTVSPEIKKSPIEYLKEQLSSDELKYFLQLSQEWQENTGTTMVDLTSHENFENTVLPSPKTHFIEVLCHVGISFIEGKYLIIDKIKYFELWKNLSGITEIKNLKDYEDNPAIWYFVLKVLYEDYIVKQEQEEIEQDYFYTTMKRRLKVGLGWKLTNEVPIKNVTQFLLSEGLLEIGRSKYFASFRMSSKGYKFIGKFVEEDAEEVPEKIQGFKNKTRPELEHQLKQVQDILGKESLHSLLPKSEQEDVFSLSEGELKKKYPRRYEIYVKTLRKQRNQTDTVILLDQELGNFRHWLAILNSLDRYILRHKEGLETTLYERQLAVFEDLRKFLENGGREGYIKLPTGVGKTVLFTEFVESIDVPTLIVVPTRLLIHQTEDKIKEFAPELDVGKVYTKARQFGRQITIITYSSFVRRLKSGEMNPNDYDCLILDEAHTSLSEKRVSAVKEFSHSINIGFTATPEYSEKKKVSGLLETEIHRMEITEAVESNLLARFSTLVAKTDIDLSQVRITATGEYDERDLEFTLNVPDRNNAAVAVYKKLANGERSVVYCVGIVHAQEMEKVFNDAGIKAVHISGKTSEERQEQILVDFKNGEIQVITNADLLIAGFDEPKAKLCLNLRPTLSRVIAEQRGGRVLRLDREDPTKKALIIDFLDESKGKSNPILFSEITKGFGSEDEEIETIGGIKLLSRQEDINSIRQPKEVRKTTEKLIAPEGWLSARNFAEEFNVSPRCITRLVKTYLDEYSEQMGLYNTNLGPMGIFIHPELATIFRRDLEDIRKATMKLPQPKFMSTTALKKGFDQRLEDQINAIATVRQKFAGFKASND